MLNLLLYFICFLRIVFFDPVDAAAFIVPAQPKPSKFACEGCYQPDFDAVLAYKEIFSPQDGKSCMQYTCNTDGTTSIFTCGALGIPYNCTQVPGNKFLPYPRCCDGVSCPPKPPTTTATFEDQDPVPRLEEATPQKPNDLLNHGPPDTAPLENSKSKDPDDSTDIPISPPKCPLCPNVPKSPILEFDYLLNSPSETLPVLPPETQPLDPTEIKPIIISTNNTDNSPPNTLNPSLNHGPVFQLPVETPGGVSRVARPNLDDQPIDPRCTFPPINSDGTLLQDSAGLSGLPHCPPWAGLPMFADSVSDKDSEKPLYRQPINTLPVQPPVNS